MTKYQKMKEYAFLKGSQSKILEQLRYAKNINFIDFVDEKSNTPLHYATSLNYLHAVNQYIELLKKKQLWEDKLNQQITNQVIRYKTKVWLNAENNQGLTALHYASLKGFTQIADVLEDAGARVDKITNHGFNILHLAAQEGKLNSLIHFRGKLDLSASDNNGSTVLHWAAYRGHEKIVRYLVSQDQIQLNFQDRQGRTPLHIAIVYQHFKIAQILLLAGASRNIKDKNNQTAINLAEQKGNEKLLKLVGLKQPCRYKAEYVFSKKQKQHWKWIAIMFIMLFGLVISNFLVGRTLLIYNQEHSSFDILGEINNKLAYSLIYLAGELALVVVALVLSLRIHLQKSTIKRYSLAYLEENIGLSDEYCFQCQVIFQLGTKHCYYCNQCSPIQIKHSHVLGRCINEQNKYMYLFFLVFILLVLLSQLYRGFFLLNYIIQQRNNAIDFRVLKYILTMLDIICLVPLMVASYFLYKTGRSICKVRKRTQIKKLSQSTFDSRSTLIAQKIKQFHKKPTFNINNSKDLMRENISQGEIRR